MAKVQFSTTVKYLGQLIPPYTTIEVRDADFDAVVKSGCTVLEPPKYIETVATTVETVTVPEETVTNDVTNEEIDINQEYTKDENSPIKTSRARRTRRG